MSILDHPMHPPGQACGPGGEADHTPRRLLGRLPTRSYVVIGFLAALQAALGSLLAVAAPVALLRATDTRTGADWPEVGRVAADLWLVGHGTTIALPAGEFSLLPLGLTLCFLWWARYCAGRVLDLCDDGTGTARAVVLRAVAVFVPTYTAAVAGVAALVGTQTVRPVLGSAVAAGVVVAALAMVWSGYPLWRGEGPRWVRLEVVGRAAGLALRWWAWTSLGLLAVSVLRNWDRIRDVQAALQPEGVGVLGLVVLQALLLPTATVWAGAWLAGPGFGVGTGTLVNPFETELAPVPALPLLGALPHAGPGPVIAWFAPLLVVLAGVAAGIRLSRQPVDQVDQRWWMSGFRVALGAGVVAFPLFWVSTGSVGPDRLADVGPSVLLATGCVMVEIGVGAMLGAGLGPIIVDGRVGQKLEGLAAKAWRSERPLVRRAGAGGAATLEWVRARAAQGRDRSTAFTRAARIRWVKARDGARGRLRRRQ